MKEFFSTLISSWGSDTPSEVFWALEDLVKYAKSKGFETDLFFQDPIETSDNEEIVLNNEELIEKLTEFFDNLH